MPLLFAPANTNLQIAKITGNDNVQKRLNALGLVTGASLVILEQTSSGLIIRINDSRLALDKDVASKVVVEIY